MNKNIS